MRFTYAKMFSITFEPVLKGQLYLNSEFVSTLHHNGEQGQMDNGTHLSECYDKFPQNLTNLFCQYYKLLRSTIISLLYRIENLLVIIARLQGN